MSCKLARVEPYEEQNSNFFIFIQIYRWYEGEKIAKQKKKTEEKFENTIGE